MLMYLLSNERELSNPIFPNLDFIINITIVTRNVMKTEISMINHSSSLPKASNLAYSDKRQVGVMALRALNSTLGPTKNT